MADRRSIRGRGALLSLVLLLAAGPAGAETITGPARILDGDTIEIGAQKVRLFGIDAPETAQTCRDAERRSWACGEASARRLRAMIARRPVTCSGETRDDYGRLLGFCRSGEIDLNRQLVVEGLAWAFVRYSDRFVAEERQARARRVGVFAAENITPWAFRADRWGTATADAARRCPIKGNISSKGDRIYHLPWQKDYGRVKIDEAAGERWFCDEGEAIRAGWRRAGR